MEDRDRGLGTIDQRTGTGDQEAGRRSVEDNISLPGTNELIERAGEVNILKVAGKVSRHEDDYFSRPEGHRLFWKPLQLTLGAGLPGLLLLATAVFLPSLAESLGWVAWFQPGGMGGLLQVSLALAAFILLMLALPLYKPLDWTPRQQLELERERDHYHRKKFGGG